MTIALIGRSPATACSEYTVACHNELRTTLAKLLVIFFAGLLFAVFDVTAEENHAGIVKEVQLQLRTLEYDVGPADGVMGPRTRAAIRSFQKNNNLKVSGKLDVDTMATLRASSILPESPPLAPVSGQKIPSSKLTSDARGSLENIASVDGARSTRNVVREKDKTGPKTDGNIILALIMLAVIVWIILKNLEFIIKVLAVIVLVFIVFQVPMLGIPLAILTVAHQLKKRNQPSDYEQARTTYGDDDADNEPALNSTHEKMGQSGREDRGTVPGVDAETPIAGSAGSTLTEQEVLVADYVPPESVDLYEGNALQLFGITQIDLKARLLEKRKNELTVLLQSGLGPADVLKERYMSVQWSPESMLTIKQVNDAYEKLQNPGKRMREAYLWFIPSEDTPDAARSCLAAGDLGGAEKIWKEMASACDDGLAYAVTQHNLAVLGHARLLRAEDQVKIGSYDYDAKKQEWTDVFQLFRESLQSSETRGCFGRLLPFLRDGSKDAENEILKFQRQVPSIILSISSDIARAAQKKGLFRHSHFHIALIKESGFDEESVRQAIKQASEDITAEIRKIAADSDIRLSNVLPENSRYCSTCDVVVPPPTILEERQWSDYNAGKCPECGEDMLETIPWESQEKQRFYSVVRELLEHLRDTQKTRDMLGLDGCCSVGFNTALMAYECGRKEIVQDWNVLSDEIHERMLSLDDLAAHLLEEWNRQIETIGRGTTPVWSSVGALYKEESVRRDEVCPLLERAKDVADTGETIIGLLRDLHSEDEYVEWFGSDLNKLREAKEALMNGAGNILSRIEYQIVEDWNHVSGEVNETYPKMVEAVGKLISRWNASAETASGKVDNGRGELARILSELEREKQRMGNMRTLVTRASNVATMGGIALDGLYELHCMNEDKSRCDKSRRTLSVAIKNMQKQVKDGDEWIDRNLSGMREQLGMFADSNLTGLLDPEFVSRYLTELEFRVSEEKKQKIFPIKH
ncbi:MAG: peptidoglycan-binding protein [Candidatus Thiodiazotropha sp. (ex Lucinoma borealis)]|nr:peptidoglycan-binding protein [Candidatus Thiodiazotropha sp. (ex Lucinoma borealis)]